MGGGSPDINEHGASHSGGVKVMGIQGRMALQRERMLGMTDAERAWRAQWVKDQVLHGEPVTPTDYYKQRYNVIRRFYRAPLDAFERQLNKFFVSCLIHKKFYCCMFSLVLLQNE